MITVAEIRVMQLQAKKKLAKIASKSPEVKTGKEGFPYGFQRERDPNGTLISDF